MGRRHTEDGDERALRDSPRAGWAIAKEVFQCAFASEDPRTVVEVGRVRHLGRGLSRRAWGGEITIRPDPSGLSGGWIASVPYGEAAADPELPTRVAREARLLSWLEARERSFRVPRSVPPVGGVLVSEWMDGLPLDDRRYRDLHRATFLAVAPSLHALEPPAFLPGFDTRRAHALDAVERIAMLEDPIVGEVRSWALEHLPPATPSVLVHGDLLGQNLLFHFDLPPAVIDWQEAIRGDPACDLAIVTRGQRQPFGEPRGTELLVEAYGATGPEIALAQVRIHELGMLADWARVAQEGVAGNALGQFRNVARRALSSDG